MNILKPLILTLVFASTTFTQYSIEFSGYAVDLPVYSSNNDFLSKITQTNKNQFLNLTRVRLRPQIFLWNGARINYEHEIDLLYSKEISLFDLTSTNNRRQYFDLKWQPVNSKETKIIHYVDRLYFRQGFDWGNFTIGRQRISWGTGRIWNPTDLFNPINPANFSKLEKDGADVVSITYNFGSFTDLNLVYNPLDKPENSNAGFRFRTNYDEFDISVIGGYFDKRIVAGGDFAGNLFDAGVRGEGIISMDRNNLNENYIKFILGADNQFTSKLYALIEYQFNGEGKEDKLRYNFGDLLKGKILNLSRNYIFLSGNYLLTPLLTFTLSNNLNLNDGSGFTGFSGSYSLTGNFYVNLGAQLTYGKQFTEYWFYPTSVYLQGEFYF